MSPPVTRSSPKPILAPGTNMSDGNNAHQMKPVSTIVKSASRSHPSSSRATNIQAVNVKKVISKVTRPKIAPPVTRSSPKPILAPGINMSDGNNAHQMKPVSTIAKSASRSHPSSSRATRIQTTAVKKVIAKASHPTVTESQEISTRKLPIKKRPDLLSTPASLSGGGSTAGVRIKSTTSPSISELRAPKAETLKNCNGKNKTIAQQLQGARVPGATSLGTLGPKKVIAPVLKSKDCIPKTINHANTVAIEDSNLLSKTSRGIIGTTSSQERTPKIRNVNQGLRQTLNNVPNDCKRPAKTIPSKAKKRKLEQPVFLAARSTSIASRTKHTTPPLASETMNVQSNQKETSMEVRTLRRRPIVASPRTHGFQKKPPTVSTIPTKSRVSISSHIQQSSPKQVISSDQTKFLEVSRTPKLLLMNTVHTNSAVKKSIVPKSVRSAGSISQRSSVAKGTSRNDLSGAALDVSRGIQRTNISAPHRPAMKMNTVKYVSPEMQAISQASPVLTTKPSTGGQIVRHITQAIAQPGILEKRKHVSPSCSGANYSLSQRLVKPPSSVSTVVQSMKVDKTSQGKCLTHIKRHATEANSSKTTNSKTMIQTTKMVATVARKAPVTKSNVKARSEQKAAMVPAKVPAKVPHRVQRPPNVDVRTETKVISQPNLTPKRPASFQKCDRQNLNMSITQRSPCRPTGSCTKLTSVNHLCMKGTSARITESPALSIRKPAAAVGSAVKQVSGDSTKPAELVTKHIITTTQDQGRSKAQTSRVIHHHSITNQRTRTMKATDIVKETPINTTAGINKPLSTTGAVTDSRTQTCLLVDPSKAQNRSGTGQIQGICVTPSALEKKSTQQINGSALQMRASAAKQGTVFPSAVRETDGGKRANTSETPRSGGVTTDGPRSTGQNEAGMSGKSTGSCLETSDGIASKRVEKNLPGEEGSSSGATGDVTQSNAPAGNSSENPEGLTVVELPYGSPRTISLRTEDMERHIPVWNAKLKYKVAGTAAPLGKNIARYLARKNGEFEVYNKQEKYEPVQERKNARVTIWHKIEKRKISGTSAPLRKNIDRYLRDHPHCEKYVDQQSKMDATEKKYANARVTVWNKKMGRKQGFGQSGPLRKNLKRYLMRHPHLEEYIGQDNDKPGSSSKKGVQETDVAQQEQNETSQGHQPESQDIVVSGNAEDEMLQSHASEEYTFENLGDIGSTLEQGVMGVNDGFEEAESFPDNSSADLGEALPEMEPYTVDLSLVPDLNAFPFSDESVELDEFGMDPVAFLPPGQTRQLEDTSNSGPYGSPPGMDMQIHRSPIYGGVGDDFAGDVIYAEQQAFGMRMNDGPVRPPVELEPLGPVDLLPGEGFDGTYMPEDIIFQLD